MRHVTLVLATGLLACTTVHRPVAEPITSDSLTLAVDAIRTSSAEIEIVEDGLQAAVYHYEWRELEPLTGPRSYGAYPFDPILDSRPSMRMLSGPRESVHLPFRAIESVEARSWPLWSGVEIHVAGIEGEELLGPLVIRAEDAEDAARLTDAIDCLRRARELPSVAAAPWDRTKAGKTREDAAD